MNETVFEKIEAAASVLKLDFSSEEFANFESLYITRLLSTFTPTLQPPQNKSTKTSMSLGNSGNICGNNLYLPPV